MKIGFNNEIASAEVKRYTPKEAYQPNDAPKIMEEKKVETPKAVEAASKPSNEQLQKMVEEANAKMTRANRHVKFELFERDSGNYDVAIKVMDSKTQEVLAEIPSEEMIEFSNKMEEVIGMLFDKKG